ncbi:MAG: alpha/beta hydrolase [Candidatus Thorarchaeota archaeon]
MVLENRKLTGFILLSGIILLIHFFSFYFVEALNQETIQRRDLEIDLGNDLKTDAQLTYPSIGKGPFPCVLLIQGSGSVDMDGYTPSWATGTGELSTPLLQIAEYLSERGFAVLRYNKRGVGLGSSLLDQDIFMNITFQTLMQDADTALQVLLEQEEVDASDVTIIGHSEGSIIAPRIAYNYPCVKKIILLGAVAHNLRDILEYQTVDRKVEYLEEVIDGDKDGLISINEVVSLGDSDIFLPVPDFTLIENRTGEWQWPIGIDSDGDGLMSIDEEYASRNLSYLDMVTSSEYPLFKWFRSHYELDPTLGMIGNVSCSVLFLQGKDDVQVPVQEAFLLEQRLSQVKHPDHTLRSYPGLGHSFYPVDGWKQPLGPIQDYVLSDITAWLTDPARNVQYFHSQLRTSKKIIDELKDQYVDFNSELALQNEELNKLDEDSQSESKNIKQTIDELKNWNTELQMSQISSRNLTYIALGISLFTVVKSLHANPGRDSK